MIIGLTGFYCSGKTTVDNILKNDYDFYVIDVDKLGHETLNECSAKISETFGPDTVSDGVVDRKKLGSIVFSDKRKLEQLNKITHPAMVEKVKRIIESKKNEHIVISAALLFDMGLDCLCEKIFVIKAPFIKILFRGRKRDNRKLSQIINILKNQQLKRFLKTRRNIIYILNSGSFSNLKNKILKSLIKTGVIIQ